MPSLAKLEPWVNRNIIGTIKITPIEKRNLLRNFFKAQYPIRIINKKTPYKENESGIDNTPKNSYFVKEFNKNLNTKGIDDSINIIDDILSAWKEIA